MMDDEDLNLAFAMFKNKYFGKLRPCRCWFAEMLNLGHFGTFRSVEGYIDGDRATHYIRINKKLAWSRSLVYMTLLHEMVHLKLYGKDNSKTGDSRIFHKEMKKLAARGAFVGLW